MIDRDVLNAIIQEAINFPRIPTFKRPYELHKRVHLIDIPIAIRGYINGRRNRLTRQFYTALANWIAKGIDLWAKSTDGTDRRPFQSDRGIGGKSRIAIGSDTDEFLFGDYTLVSKTEYNIELASYQELSDRIRVIAEKTAEKDGTSIGLLLYAWVDSTYIRYFLIAGRLQNVTNGQVIDYYLDFFEPWLKNMALLWYGFLGDISPTIVGVDGVSFSAVVKDSTGRGNARLCAGTSDNPFSFDDYALTNEIEITSDRLGNSTSSYTFLIYYGNYVPASDLAIYEIGLKQSIKDTGGVSHDALLCRIVLSTPITLVAGKNNLIMLRILGM